MFPGGEDVHFAESIRTASSVVVGAHVDPDGDAVGSTLGLVLALRSIGIDASPVLPSSDAVPQTYSFLPGSELYRHVADLTAPDLFIALDTPGFARLGDAEPLARDARKLIVIDHHPDNARYGTLSIVDASASSVGAMVWGLLGTLGVEPDARIATCLYTALVTDTGRFSYSNTSPEALRTAASMLEAGVDVQQVFTDVYESRSVGALALIGRTLERITCVQDGAIAYSWVTDDDFAETGALKAESENLIDEVRALRGARIVFLMKLNAGAVRVSLRAKGGADVGSVARAFGGGGHSAAAGFTFDGEVDALLNVLLPALTEVLA
ncbi:MAG: DHH family phosphoesterase [Coriobacteriia bacterium]|nr:DHH family phosphoesterase [Coriobacteriia bacterium]MBN2822793.1 DHH family phosphoesterase [Coriobacteriia bacterium]